MMPISSHSPALVAVPVAALISVALSFVAMRWVGPHGFMDHPAGRRQHAHPVPRTGGMALIAAVLIGELLGLSHLPFTWQDWTGILALLVVGIADDRLDLSARYKAIVGFSVALWLAVWTSASMVSQGASLTLFGVVLPVSHAAYLPLLVLLFWGTPFCFNLVDGMNGLASGYAGVVVLMLGLDGMPAPYLGGALLGIFLLNWPRAKHFMGDAGSLTLGLILALLVLKGPGLRDPNTILPVLAYPFMDTLLAVSIRASLGQPLGIGDRNHYHHHLQRLLPGRECWVVPILWGQSALCASVVILDGFGRLVGMLGLGLFILEGLWFRHKALKEAKPRHATHRTRLTATRTQPMPVHYPSQG